MNLLIKTGLLLCLSTISFQVMAAAPQCSTVHKAKMFSDTRIRQYIDYSSHLTAGEFNANIISFFFNNKDQINLPGVVTLVKSLRPTMGRTAGGQFFRHFERDYSAIAILRETMAMHYLSLSRSEVIYLLELSPNSAVRQAVERDYPIPQN